MLQGELLLVLKDDFKLLLQLQIRSQLFFPELGKIDDPTQNAPQPWTFWLPQILQDRTNAAICMRFVAWMLEMHTT